MRNRNVGRTAFTLAEIMIVIVLIAILAGFLLPAVQNSQRAARRAACNADINTLKLAIDSFHNDWGFYPPTDFAFNPATGNFDGAALGAYSYSEALVHCLCNRFTRGAGDATFQGIDNLIGGAPVNAGPYYQVKAGDLVDLDQDGWPELPDPWNNPYIYIPNQDYLVDNDGDGFLEYNAGALAMIDFDGDGAIDLPDLNADPLDAGYFHYQRFSFQLISRGEDGWTPGINDYTDISITSNPYGAPPSASDFNPALIGTDTDASAPFVVPVWGHTNETADDINNW